METLKKYINLYIDLNENIYLFFKNIVDKSSPIFNKIGYYIFQILGLLFCLYGLFLNFASGLKMFVVVGINEEVAIRIVSEFLILPGIILGYFW